MGGSAAIMGHVSTLQRALDTLSGNIGRSADPNASTQIVQVSTQSHGDKMTSLKVSAPRIYTNPALAEEIRVENANVGYASTIGEVLERFDRVLGQPGTMNSLTNQIARLQNALARFSARPENISAKREVVTMAAELAETFKTIENALQNARQSTENDIEADIRVLKDKLIIVADTNVNIAAARRQNTTAASEEDNRRVALNEISTLLKATIYEDAEGRANVTAAIGSRNISLLQQPETPISFQSTPTLGSSTKYPAEGLNGLMIAGLDVTPQLPQGRLKALFELRDKILPSLSDQFSQIAETLKEEINTIHNNAASYPGSDQLTGTKVVTGTDTFFAQGQFRIAALDSGGIVQNVGDVNLAGVTTVNGLVTALNGALTAAGGAASIDADGHLKIVAANGKYIAINENTSQVLPSTIKVELFNSVGSSIGVFNYNSSVLGSNAAIVAQMNTDFGVNAKAELVGNKIHVTALGSNKISLDDFPRVYGATIRSKGVSHYFGLNNFFHGETNPLSPHVSAKLLVNPALERNTNLISHGMLSLTATPGQIGTSNQGLPDASGAIPAHKYPAVFEGSAQFFATESFSGRRMGFADYVSATMGYFGAEAENARDKHEMSVSQRDNFSRVYEQASRKSLREMMLMLTEYISAMRSVHMVVSQTMKLEENLRALVR